MSYFRFLLLALVLLTGSAFISESAPVYMARRDSKFALVPLCDGFDFPVGKPDGNGYYRSRRLRLPLIRAGMAPVVNHDQMGSGEGMPDTQQILPDQGGVSRINEQMNVNACFLFHHQ